LQLQLSPGKSKLEFFQALFTDDDTRLWPKDEADGWDRLLIKLKSKKRLNVKPSEIFYIKKEHSKR